jgi:hypothetical protein
VKYWEIIADNLHNAGWSLGWVSAIDSQKRTIWIVDAHSYGKRFIVRAEEKLTAFLELESAIRACSELYDRMAVCAKSGARWRKNLAAPHRALRWRRHSRCPSTNLSSSLSSSLTRCGRIRPGRARARDQR